MHGQDPITADTWDVAHLVYAEVAAAAPVAVAILDACIEDFRSINSQSCSITTTQRSNGMSKSVPQCMREAMHVHEGVVFLPVYTCRQAAHFGQAGTDPAVVRMTGSPI